MDLHPGYALDLEAATKTNKAYRHVIYTSPDRQLQLVLMSLIPGEDIPWETHPDHVQFLRVESGQIEIQLGHFDAAIQGTDGSAFVVPAGTAHYVRNCGTTDLKLYTIYTPAEHPADRYQFRQPN